MGASSKEAMVPYGKNHGRANVFLLCILCGSSVFARQLGEPARRIDSLRSTFRVRPPKLQEQCLKDIKSREDWEAKRVVYRQQLLEMLGLDPFPAKTPLNADRDGHRRITSSSPWRSCISSRCRGCT